MSEHSTAMDVVRRARNGEMSQDELVATLSRWQFEPTYRTTGLADDWESRPNSFDAVEYAYLTGLLDDDAYRYLFEVVGRDR
ncbi:MAG: hypothetical protein Q7T17_05060 [Microbacterium sp.]|uniref:hypothetical protein n=1 Tax=Microbacterium sp. TaxID=51671 RepID=UPI002722CFCE|nr:hypothetical protein [Microbacterium sp.]MDO8382330.1 hypothetical protein [Microbacterium sp.]